MACDTAHWRIHVVRPAALAANPNALVRDESCTELRSVNWSGLCGGEQKIGRRRTVVPRAPAPTPTPSLVVSDAKSTAGQPSTMLASKRIRKYKLPTLNWAAVK